MAAGRPLEATTIFLITNVTNGPHLLGQLRTDFHGHLRWSQLIALPGGGSVIGLEIPTDFDPEPIFEKTLDYHSKLVTDDFDPPFPSTLYVLNLPTTVTRSVCQNFVNTLSDQAMEHRVADVTDVYTGVLIIRASEAHPVLRRAKMLFEQINTDGRDPVIVFTHWDAVPVVHFGNLPPDMDAEGFEDVFRDFLPDGTRIHKLRDHENHSQFNCVLPSHDQVWPLIDQLSYGTVSGDEIRVSHFCPHEDLMRISHWNLYIAGVHQSLTHAELTSVFSEYGRLLSVNTKPFSGENVVVSLQYLSEDDFRSASRTIPIRHPGVIILTPRETGFVVYNFRQGITEEEIRAVFRAAHDVRVDAPRDAAGRPIAWIGFNSREECEVAMEHCETLFSENLRLMCVPKALGKAEAFAQTNERNKDYQKRNTVYIPSLPKNATRETVIKACEQYGKLNCCVVISPAGKVRCGFAAFVKGSAYRAALRGGLDLGAPTRTRVSASRTNVNPDGEEGEEEEDRE